MYINLIRKFRNYQNKINKIRRILKKEVSYLKYESLFWQFKVSLFSEVLVNAFYKLVSYKKHVLITLVLYIPTNVLNMAANYILHTI